jgi:hypothetical protein
MYKCGWNGCEKAYGTLNHLNAHVTMQSHGTKRTPEGTWHDFSGLLMLSPLLNGVFWLGLLVYWVELILRERQRISPPRPHRRSRFCVPCDIARVFQESWTS